MNPLSVSILFQINRFHPFLPHIFTIHFNIISHLQLSLASLLFNSAFRTTILYAFLFCILAACLAIYVNFDFNSLIYGEATIIKLLDM